MRSFNKFVGLALVLMAATAPLSACKEQTAHAEAPAEQPAHKGPPVVAAQPLIKSVGEWTEFTGRFEAQAKVEVRARVNGYLEKIHFIDGQIVNEGDLLFTIDQRPFQAALKEAEAQVNSAQNRLTLATKELDRSDELAKQGYASKQSLDVKFEGKQSATADLEAAKARLDQAKLDLAYTQIRAPFKGRVSRHMVDIGNLVNGGASGSTLLTTIVSLDPIYFYFDVDEQTYLKFTRASSTDIKSGQTRINMPVQIALADSKDYEFQGTLDFVDTTLNAQTGTVRARATFKNTDYTLVPGMFGRARIQSGSTDAATLIPDEAVGVDQTQTYVLTLGPDNTVVSKTVKLGSKAEGMRIIHSGLTPEDKVIIKGVQMLRDGMPVTPEITTLTAQTDAPIITQTPAPDAAKE